MDTLDRVAHDDEQAGPIALSELPECHHDPCVNPLLVWLPQTHHQDAAMLLVAVLGETLVRGDQHPLLSLSKRPKLVVEHPLPLSAADVENIVYHRPERSEERRVGK